MKKVFLMIAGFYIINISYSQVYCEPVLLEKAMEFADTGSIFLKEMYVYLPERTEGEEIPVAKYSLVLAKGHTYEFAIASSKNYKGTGKLELYSADNLIGTTYNMATGKNVNSFIFLCQKTGVYHVFISFIDGFEGCATGVLLLNKIRKQE